MGLRNKNFSTAFCSHFHIFSHCQTAFSHFPQAHFQFAFFHIFHKNVKTCEEMRFENALRKMLITCVLKMHLEKCEKCEKNIWKSSWEGGTLKSFLQVWFFCVQFCCSYFAACPISAGWKSERSSSNRSEVDCADRRSVQFIYSKTMPTRSKNIKSNAEGKGNKASKLLDKTCFYIFKIHLYTSQK